MALPIMTDKEDIDAVVKYLRAKPVGVNIDEAKATGAAKLFDGRKLNAYRTWGFITDNNGKITLTSLGRSYSGMSENEKQAVYGNILRNERIYQLTLEWLNSRKDKDKDNVAATDVAAHWFTHFRAEIGTEAEQSVTNQVVGFMNVASAAGLGEYKIGRRGQPTRLEININALQQFIDEQHEKIPNPEVSTQPDINENIDSGKGGTTSSDSRQAKTTQFIPQPSQSPQNVSNVPSLHIDIQIHIDSDASTDQIDQIFASMAKHLYKTNNE
jgi:hypothetical protein